MGHTDPLDTIVLRHAALTCADGSLKTVRLVALPRRQKPRDPAVWMPAIAAALQGSVAPLRLHLQRLDELVAAAALPVPLHLQFDLAASLAADPLAEAPLVTLCAAGAVAATAGAEPRATTLAAMERAFATGAEAALGWPVNGTVERGPVRTDGNDIAVLMALMRRVTDGETPQRLESLLDRSPALGFRLLRHLNTAAVRTPVRIESLRHAIMLMGYRELRHWLALLLLREVQTARNQPLAWAATRRAFLLQQFAQCVGAGPAHGEMFLVGAFSLLDRMFGQSMAELVTQLPLAEAVASALVDGSGPLQPYLALARWIEDDGTPDADPEPHLEATLLSAGEVNRCVLAALMQAARSP
jgi:hypothetical protein